jgi:hypothetical protein
MSSVGRGQATATPPPPVESSDEEDDDDKRTDNVINAAMYVKFMANAELEA